MKQCYKLFNIFKIQIENHYILHAKTILLSPNFRVFIEIKFSK